MWWGEGLTHHDVLWAGDFVYIPADVPHLPGNPSATEQAVAVVAVRIRTSRRASCCCPTLTTCRRCPDGSPAIGSVERSHYSSLPGRVRKKLSLARFGRRPHDPR